MSTLSAEFRMFPPTYADMYGFPRQPPSSGWQQWQQQQWVDDRTSVQPPYVPSYGEPIWIVQPSVTVPMVPYPHPQKLPTVPSPTPFQPQRTYTVEELELMLAAAQQHALHDGAPSDHVPTPFEHLQKGQIGYASRRDVVERDGAP